MNWKKTKERTLFDGYRKLIGRTFELPDGRREEFEVRCDGDTVCVVAFTSQNTIVLAKQFRPGPEKYVAELPGGVVEQGRTLLEQAEQELFEETGFQGRLEYVASYLSDAYSTRTSHVFLGRDCRKVGKPKNDTNEFVELVEMDMPQFRGHLRSGQLSDVQGGYLVLDYLGLL